MSQKVLIIDDSAAIHSLLRARLKDEPMVLHSASGPEQGLEMAVSIAPDLVLLDVEMPGMDGFAVFHRLQKIPEMQNTPVIFLTGAASTEQKIRGLELGAVDYITKPFDPAELRARVRGALRMKFMIDLLSQKAQIDALTGLWNRRFFDQRLEAEISLSRRSHRPLSVLVVDLDHFKAVNDRYGHPAGDEVLRTVGLVLGQSVRVEDVVCRYGGEEFAIIAPNIDSGAEILAERLRQIVAAMRITLGGREARITASIGVAVAAEPDSSIVSTADEALYRAKKAGRNCVECTTIEPAGSASHFIAPPT